MMEMVMMMAAWDLGSFLANSTKTIQGWVGLVIVLIGVVMIGAGIFFIGKGLLSKREPVEWGKVAILIFLGGAFTVGGWNFVSSIAAGGKKTIEDLGSAMIMFSGTFDSGADLMAYLRSVPWL